MKGRRGERVVSGAGMSDHPCSISEKSNRTRRACFDVLPLAQRRRRLRVYNLGLQPCGVRKPSAFCVDIVPGNR